MYRFLRGLRAFHSTDADREEGSSVFRTHEGINRQFPMPQPLDPKDLVTLDELAISTQWKIAALGERLERNGVLTRQEL